MADDQFMFEFQPPAAELPQLWTPDDIYITCNQVTIETFAEDRRVEHKAVEVSAKAVGEYLSMWSNTQPAGGVIFIGVDKNGRISGCAHSETAHLNEIETARRHCLDARVESKRVAVTDYKGNSNFVIALRVFYRADKLVETPDGSAFVREGDEKRLLTEAEKREIRLNKGELDAETERVPLRFPEDFNADLMSGFRDAYVASRKLTARYSTEEVLQLCKLGVVTPGGFLPNLACAIVFASDSRTIVPGAFIRVIRYEGREEGFGQRMNFVADEIFDGPLPLQIAAAESYIASQVRNFTRLGRDARFRSSPEYPKDVWFEAIVNAAVHRSYNLKNMNIFVKLFEDKMVIESPGAFFPPTTATTVYDSHNPRNPHLMWAMYYFDFVQCAYEGTRRMRMAMEEANLPAPVFEQRQGGVFQVSVILQNDVEHRKSFVRTEAMPAIIDPLIYESLSQQEKILVNWAAEGKRLTVKDAQDVLTVDWRTARGVLDSLTVKFVFERPPGRDRDRNRKWHLRSRRVTRIGRRVILPISE